MTPPFRELDALSWYASAHEATVFAAVPLTGPGWRGWGDQCSERCGTVAIPSKRGPHGIQLFDEAKFRRRLDTAPSVTVLIGSAGAGRYAHGHLATQAAFLEKTWRPRGKINSVLVVGPGRDRTNVSDSFQHYGMKILALPGETSQRRGGGGWRAYKDPWREPRTLEDRLLHALWLSRNKRGWWFAEAPVGWGAPRRIDAVRVNTRRPAASPANQDVEDLRRVVRSGCKVELIEAKPNLDEEVVGQLLGGAPMFQADFPGKGAVGMTACVRSGGDEAMQWFADRAEIRVELFKPS